MEEFTVESVWGIREAPIVSVVSFGLARTDPMRLIKAACTLLDVTMEAMVSKNNHHSVSHPRGAIMWLLRAKTTLSQERVGMFFNKNHATVLYWERQVGNAEERFLPRLFNLRKLLIENI